MKLGIDVDGVLARFNDGFLRIADRIWPRRIPAGFTPTEWDWSDAGLSSGEVDRVWESIRATRNFWMSLPAYFDSVHSVARERIRHPEDEVFYCTARVPTEGLPVMHQTQRWLEMCGIAGVGTAVIVKPDGVSKASLYKRLRVAASLDDNLQMAMENNCLAGHHAFLLDHAWNRSRRPSSLSVVESVAAFYKSCRGEKLQDFSMDVADNKYAKA